MRKITLLTFLLFAVLFAAGQCPNGDAEMNNFTNWNGYTGLNTGGVLNLSTFTPGIVNDRHTIVSRGNNDPIVGAAIPLVAEGNYAIRLGNSNVGSQAEILSYTFTVPAQFSFRYAMVLQDPTAHAMSEKPFFSYWVSKTADLASSNTAQNLIASKKFISDVTNPFYKNTIYQGGALVYKEWETECVPALSAYVGEQVTIFFATADCSQAAHFGYAYIDGLCKANEPEPQFVGPAVLCNKDAPVIFDGSATLNETDYIWTIAECDANGVDITPIGQRKKLQGTANVGLLDFKTVWGIPEDGHYYSITLSVNNCTGGGSSVRRILAVKYPYINTSNAVICCGSSLTMGAMVSESGAEVATNYKWYGEDGAYLGNGTLTSTLIPIINKRIYTSKLTVSPSIPTKYRVVFEANGCKNEKWIYVTTMSLSEAGSKFNCSGYNNCTGRGAIEVQPFYTLCPGSRDIQDKEYHLQAAQNALSYTWNTGETTSKIEMMGNNTYTVTVNSPCGPVNLSITPPIFQGAFPNLTWSTAMNSTQFFKVFQVGINRDVVPAYNANHYELSIYDRWNNRVYYKVDNTCLGFFNGEIQWDGTDNNGFLTNPNGVYKWYLYLSNCTGNKTIGGEVTLLR